MLDSEQLLAQTPPTSVFDKLPPELLVQVFFLLRPSSWTYGMKRKYQFASPLATFLWPTQVCSAWRSAALACPTLWNLLPGPTPEITRYMLDRSAHAPLMVVLDFPTDLLISDLPLLLTQMHRIQYLKLRGILNNNELQAVYQALHEPAPGLLDLVIGINREYDVFSDTDLIFGNELPDVSPHSTTDYG
jgi:hypothetical protein